MTGVTRMKLTTRRLTILVLAAAAVSTAAALAGPPALRGRDHRAPAAFPPSSAPSSAPSSVPPSPLPSSTAPDRGGGSAGGAPAEPGNAVRFLDDATATRLRNTTITLPEWGGSPELGCPSGRFTFSGGRARAGTDAIGRPTEYWILHKGLRGILADVDGVRGDEILAPLGCGYPELRFALLAMKPDGRGLGYVVAAGRHIGHLDRFYPQGRDVVVEVQDSAYSTTYEQRRRYRWQGSRFVQVGGPTAFPAGVDWSTVDLGNWSFGVYAETPTTGRCGSGGFLSFVNGDSGVWGYREESITIDEATFRMGGVSRGYLSEPAGHADLDVIVTLSCRRPDGQTGQFVWRVGQTGSLVVEVGVDGVTGILGHRVTGGLAEVTVRTARGREVRRYRSNGYVFTRVG